jgi:hypothetical protein
VKKAVFVLVTAVLSAAAAEILLGGLAATVSMLETHRRASEDGAPGDVVLWYGGSYVHGPRLASYTAVVERHLNERLPGRRWTVVNMARRRMGGLIDASRTLSSDIVRFKPKLVVFNINFRDVQRAPPPAFRARTQRRLRAALRDLRLARLFREAWKHSSGWRALRYGDPQARPRDGEGALKHIDPRSTESHLADRLRHADTPENRLRLAIHYLDELDPVRAAAQFHQARARGAPRHVVDLGLAQAYVEMGRWSLGEKHLLLSGDSKTTLQGLVLYADLLERRRDYRRAEELLLVALAHDDPREGRLRLADYRLRRRDVDGARRWALSSLTGAEASDPAAKEALVRRYSDADRLPRLRRFQPTSDEDWEPLARALGRIDRLRREAGIEVVVENAGMNLEAADPSSDADRLVRRTCVRLGWRFIDIQGLVDSRPDFAEFRVPGGHWSGAGHVWAAGVFTEELIEAIGGMSTAGGDTTVPLDERRNAALRAGPGPDRSAYAEGL